MDQRTLKENFGPILEWVPTECSELDPRKSGIETLRDALTKANGGKEEGRRSNRLVRAARLVVYPALPTDPLAVAWIGTTLSSIGTCRSARCAFLGAFSSLS